MRSSAALGVLPAAATAITLTGDAATPWVNGAWVEIDASAPADAVLAGLYLSGGSFTGGAREIDIGIGASSSEVVIATVRQGLWNSGSDGRQTPYMLPIPIRGIGGERVAARVRYSAISLTVTCKVMYLDNPSSQITTASLLTCLPTAASGVTVTPNGSAWANSTWVQITAGLGVPIGVVGLSFTAAAVVTPDYAEVDIGIGAAASETVITTFKMAGMLQSGTFASPANNFLILPGVYTLPASTRVAVRIRTSTTDTTNWLIAMQYYDDFSIPGSGGAGRGNKGNKGNPGVIVQVPGGPNMLVYGNPSLDVGSV